MEEVTANEIIEAYNDMFDDQVTLHDVKAFMQKNAFYGLPASFAACMLNKQRHE